ncbi:hypothetical protein HII36_41370 [Nonomuraea sp. NN258]|uniref:hypothetical protein n=1 Tax=Nonomuraea antri TaxID=2730852 RepID=UPI001568ABAC|nr:hypothetical protein [Nonomuraea antri]NRQ38238.1 hypothetical protein [Nonomuraea antri]
MIRKLHDMGIRSSHAYVAGAASIGLSIAGWAVSKRSERARVDRADRWGIFIGLWAPTLFTLGNALRIEETHTDLDESAHLEMFDHAQNPRARHHAGV